MRYLRFKTILMQSSAFRVMGIINDKANSTRAHDCEDCNQRLHGLHLDVPIVELANSLRD